MCLEAAGEKKGRSVEVRVGTLKPAYKTERKKADICACRRLHGRRGGFKLFQHGAESTCRVNLKRTVCK